MEPYNAEDYTADMYEREYQAHLAKNIAVLVDITVRFGEKFRADIEDYSKESDGFHTFKISDKKSGTYQDENWGSFKGVWIEQWSGVCEDDYHGNVWIKLPDGKYLECSF